MSRFTGQCNCGVVKFSVPSDFQPMFPSCICHCMNCRKISGTAPCLVPIKKEDLKIEGEENLVTSHVSSKLAYRFCKACGCHISQGPDGAPFVATFPDNYDWARLPYPRMPSDVFKAQSHVNFENATAASLYVKDGLPKFKDFPAAMGGSGRRMDVSYDSMCTIHPTFTILKKEECAEMMKKCVEGTKNEKGCIFYGWTQFDDKLFCREAYVDGEACLEHFKNALAIIGPCLEAGVLKVDSFRVMCGKDELPKFKEVSDGVGAEYYLVDSGFTYMSGNSGEPDEKANDSMCTIHPTFTILKKDECAEMMKKCVDATRAEKGCILYGWTMNDDKLFCREAYVDGEACLEHLKNALAIIGPCLEAGVLKVDNFRVMCGKDELPKFKEVSDGVGAEYYIVDSGFSRVQTE